MKTSILQIAWMVSLAVGLMACSKEPQQAETVQSEPPPAAETAADASGTTTYYGSPEEQPQN
jgi:hypothetical protein